jgi:hypothetical protein
MRCLCTKLYIIKCWQGKAFFRILITTKHFRILLKLQASFPIILFQGLNITFFSQAALKLVDIVRFLHLEGYNAFGRPGIILTYGSYLLLLHSLNFVQLIVTAAVHFFR